MAETQNFNMDIQDKQELKTLYECPIYKTRQRGGNFLMYSYVILFLP